MSKPDPDSVNVVPSKLAPPAAPSPPTSRSVHKLNGLAETTRFTAAVWLNAPLVPVMVNGYKLGAVLANGVTVRTGLPDVTVLGLKLKVAPAGSPLTLSA